jgi:hypothetical protein
MRSSSVFALICLALASEVSRAQVASVYYVPTPPPLVTAASEAWQINGEPIFHAGNFYYPAGPTVFFDGNTMVRVGTYKSIPLYADVTLEPYSIVFVPIGGRVMRPYERLRAGELAGTVGSRAPSFPIERDGDVSLASFRAGVIVPPIRTRDPDVFPEAWRVPSSDVVSRSQLPLPAAVATPEEPETWTGTVLQSIPPPTSNDGIWIEFDGVRWFSAGRAVSYDPERFELMGSYRGFAVFRDTRGSPNTIYVTVVADGPIAPFARR